MMMSRVATGVLASVLKYRICYRGGGCEGGSGYGVWALILNNDASGSNWNNDFRFI